MTLDDETPPQTQPKTKLIRTPLMNSGSPAIMPSQEQIERYRKTVESVGGTRAAAAELPPGVVPIQHEVKINPNSMDDFIFVDKSGNELFRIFRDGDGNIDVRLADDPKNPGKKVPYTKAALGFLTMVKNTEGHYRSANFPRALHLMRDGWEMFREGWQPHKQRWVTLKDNLFWSHTKDGDAVSYNMTTEDILASDWTFYRTKPNVVKDDHRDPALERVIKDMNLPPREEYDL